MAYQKLLITRMWDMGISCYRVKGFRHAPWRSGRRTRFCGKTYGNSVRCSGSSGRIACSLPRLPTMSVHTVCWEAGRYPKVRWSESWRLATGIFIGSISLSATTRENGIPCCSNGERRSLHFCIYLKNRGLCVSTVPLKTYTKAHNITIADVNAIMTLAKSILTSTLTSIFISIKVLVKNAYQSGCHIFISWYSIIFCW